MSRKSAYKSLTIKLPNSIGRDPKGRPFLLLANCQVKSYHSASENCQSCKSDPTASGIYQIVSLCLKDLANLITLLQNIVKKIALSRNCPSPKTQYTQAPNPKRQIQNTNISSSNLLRISLKLDKKLVDKSAEFYIPNLQWKPEKSTTNWSTQRQIERRIFRGKTSC